MEWDSSLKYWKAVNDYNTKKLEEENEKESWVFYKNKLAANQEDTRETKLRLADLIWEKRGKPPSTLGENWAEAERQLKWNRENLQFKKSFEKMAIDGAHNLNNKHT